MSKQKRNEEINLPYVITMYIVIILLLLFSISNVSYTSSLFNSASQQNKDQNPNPQKIPLATQNSGTLYQQTLTKISPAPPPDDLPTQADLYITPVPIQNTMQGLPTQIPSEKITYLYQNFNRNFASLKEGEFSGVHIPYEWDDSISTYYYTKGLLNLDDYVFISDNYIPPEKNTNMHFYTEVIELGNNLYGGYTR